MSAQTDLVARVRSRLASSGQEITSAEVTRRESVDPNPVGPLSTPTDLATRVRSHLASSGPEITPAEVARAVREKQGAVVGALRAMRRESVDPNPVRPLSRSVGAVSALVVPYGVC